MTLMCSQLIIVYGGRYDADYQKCISLRKRFIMNRFGVTYDRDIHPQSCGLLLKNGYGTAKYEVRFYNKYEEISVKEREDANEVICLDDT